MASPTTQERFKPSRLSVPCIRCGTNMPYDPLQPVDLCARCEPPNAVMSRSQPGTESLRMFGNPGKSSNTSTSYKRASATSSVKQAHAKGVVSFPKAFPAQNITKLPQIQEFCPDSEDDEFVDALEDQRSESDSMGDIDVSDLEQAVMGSASSIIERGESMTPAAIDKHGQFDGKSDAWPTKRSRKHQEVEDEDSDSDDLFKSAFGKDHKSGAVVTLEDEDEDRKVKRRPAKKPRVTKASKTQAQEPVNVKKSANVKEPASIDLTDEDTKAKQASSDELEITKVTKAKPVAPIANTTKAPTDKPTTDNPPTDPPTDPAPHIVKDLSRAWKQRQKWHQNATHFIPRLPLAKKRYWIGVLHTSQLHNQLKSEHQFLWMRGHRNTTVETIRNHFTNCTAVDPTSITLLLAFQRVDDADRVEELDFFHDHKVVFRAVPTDKVAGVEKKWCAEALANMEPKRKVVNAIELDD